jgi:hypothetical protein
MVAAAQLTLDLEPGLLERFSNLRECVTACIYARGLKRIAGDLDKSPGNLSRQLAGDSNHHFSIESLEQYVQTTGDVTPIYWLIARYMGDQAAAEGATLRRIETLMMEATALMAQSGTKKTIKR